MIPLLRPRLPSVQEIEQFFILSRDSGKFTNFGPCYQLLCKELSSRLHGYALPVADGTAAIQLAIQATIPRKSSIIIPDYTHAGTLNAVVAAGCNPILAACNKDTMTLDPECLEYAASVGASAFIVVSPFGYKVDFELYDKKAKELGLKVIYDLAGAWGMSVPTLNPYTFSLHATKNFSCGEGGIVCFNSARDFEAARALSNFGTLPDRTLMSRYGGNHKASEYVCATALAHLSAEHRIHAKSNRKRDLISVYQAELSEFCTPHDRHLGNSAPSMCVLTGMDSVNLELFGKNNGIEIKQYYVPLSRMDGLSNVTMLSMSGDWADTCVALPSDPSDSEVVQITGTIRHWLSRRAKVRG